MIDQDEWMSWKRGQAVPDLTKLFDLLDEPAICGRCGRQDLPLALLPIHNVSCTFECGLGMPATEKIDELRQRVDDLEDGIVDSLSAINWLETQLKDVNYDARGVAKVRIVLKRLLKLRKL